MITIGFYALLAAYFLPKTKSKRIIGLTGLFATLISLGFVFIANSDYDLRFFYQITNFLQGINPIYWILGWGNKIKPFVFIIIRIIIQLCLAFIALETTGYGFIKPFLPQKQKDKFEEEIAMEAERKANKVSAAINTEKAKSTAKEEKTESAATSSSASATPFENIQDSIKNAKANFDNSKTQQPNLKNLARKGTLVYKKGILVTVVTILNFLIVAIGGAAVCGALAYGAADENIFFAIIFAIIGLILGPIVYHLCLLLVFPEIFLSINMVNNGAIGEITRLNERIDALEKELGIKKTAENAAKEEPVTKPAEAPETEAPAES